MTCSNCRSPIARGLTFCPSCGAPQDPAAESLAADKPPLSEALHDLLPREAPSPHVGQAAEAPMPRLAELVEPEELPAFMEAPATAQDDWELSKEIAFNPVPTQAVAEAVVSVPASAGRVRWVAATVVVLFGIVAAVIYLRDPERQLTSRLQSGRLTLPIGASAWDAYQRLIRSQPPQETVSRARQVAIPLLTKRGDQILSELRDGNKESESGWVEASRIFEWLDTLEPSSRWRSRRWFSSGRLHLIRQAATQAEADLQRAVAEDASWALPLNSLARTAVRLGDRRGAQSYYLRATRAEPGWLYPWLNLAQISWELGDFRRAETAARAALRLDSERPSGHFYLARTLENTGRPCAAVIEYDRAVETAFRRNDSSIDVETARTRASAVRRRHRC